MLANWPKCVGHEDKGFYLYFFPLKYFQNLEQCLAHSTSLIYICWINEWQNRTQLDIWTYLSDDGVVKLTVVWSCRSKGELCWYLLQCDSLIPKAERKPQQKEKCEGWRETLSFFPPQFSQNNNKINALGPREEGSQGEVTVTPWMMDLCLLLLSPK